MLYFDFEGITSSDADDVIQDKAGTYDGTISGSGILHNIDASDVGTGNALSFNGSSHLNFQNSFTFRISHPGLHINMFTVIQSDLQTQQEWLLSGSRMKTKNWFMMKV